MTERAEKIFCFKGRYRGHPWHPITKFLSISHQLSITYLLSVIILIIIILMAEKPPVLSFAPHHYRLCLPVCPGIPLPVTMDQQTLHAALKNAAEMKDEGNAFFNAKNWTSAIAAYNQALACLPLHVPVVTSIDTEDDGYGSRSTDQGQPNADAGATCVQIPNRHLDNRIEDQEQGSFNSAEQPESIKTPSNNPTPLQEACSRARVVLHSNIAACELKLVCFCLIAFLCTHETPFPGSMGSRGEGSDGCAGGRSSSPQSSLAQSESQRSN